MLRIIYIHCSLTQTWRGSTHSVATPTPTRTHVHAEITRSTGAACNPTDTGQRGALDLLARTLFFSILEFNGSNAAKAAAKAGQHGLQYSWGSSFPAWLA